MHILGTFLLSLSTVLATTTIHYYKNPSCNAGTDVGNFNAPLNATAKDLSCHAIQNVTRALYINGLDDGCAVQTYTSPTCDPSTSSPTLAQKGDCLYLPSYDVLASWRSLCGSDLAAAQDSLEAGSASSSTSLSASADGSGSGVRTGSTTATATAATVSASARASSAAGGIRIARDGFGLSQELLVFVFVVGFGVVAMPP